MGRTGFVRERILDAAFDCFAKEGYEAVSTRDIALVAKVGHASMYKHFPSKEDLGKEIYRIAMQPIIDAFAAISGTATDKETSPKKALAQICDYLYQLYDERPRALALLIFPPHEFTPWELAKRNAKSPRSVLLHICADNEMLESFIWGAMCGPLQDRFNKRLSGSMSQHSAIIIQQLHFIIKQGT